MPQLQSYTLRNYKVICNVVLFSTYLLIATISTLVLISLNIHHQAQSFGPLVGCVIALAYILLTHLLLVLKYHHAVAYLLITFYTLLATAMIWTWGINVPLSILIFGLVIVLAGILLTARHSLIAAVASAGILLITQLAIMFNWHEPNTAWVSNHSSLGDVLAYSVVFGMLAIVSWLYNHEMEDSLAKARQAEAALLLQKATLKLQVKKRTAELRHVQLGEMQQMYRYAELGQLGVTLLHDLANHLTALTLEIDGLQSQQHSKTITRARRIMKYLGGIVDDTRARLNGGHKKQVFNIIKQTSETISFLRYKADEAHTVIDWQPPAHSWQYTGDPASLAQVIAIITCNAIDACKRTASPTNPGRVAVAMQRNGTHIIIYISDWGQGITKTQRRNLFKLSHSTKKTGLGLGLYIAKQTVELNFGGSIALSPATDHTEFTIKLPLNNEA